MLNLQKFENEVAETIYKAAANFKYQKRSGVFCNNKLSPVRDSATLNNIPIAIPTLVQIATVLPYLRLCRLTNTKSGPGLATANK